MKKTIALFAAAVMVSLLSGCGQEPAAEVIPEATSPVSYTEAPVAEPTAQPEDVAPAGEGEPEEAPVFEDNFAVDSASAESYAGKIQTVVAEQDLEGLADMAAYPLYIGFADGGVSVTSAQELVELGAERIFTADLLDAVEGAQTADLSPSMAGFSLSKDGRPNIVFGVRDGVLAIQGINY